MDIEREERINLLERLGLKEYPAKVVESLVQLGETEAPKLSSTSNVPKARIYGVLEDLADRGLIELEPGRPNKYSPIPPKEMINRIVQNRRSEAEDEVRKVEALRDDFESTFEPIYESKPGAAKGPLLKTISAGEPSEEETRKLFREAEEEIDIVSGVMEWLGRVRRTLRNSVDRGVRAKILLLSPKHLNGEEKSIQRKTVETLEGEFPKVEVKLSDSILPLRGSIVDPSYDYTSGKALFLAESRGDLSALQKVVVTEKPTLATGMKRYFDLIWDYESRELGETFVDTN